MNEMVNVLQLSFGLILLWLLWFFGWRLYRVDRVRHELFELRNELFLYAADNGISFKDGAYIILRRRIEAVIRFAHKLNVTRLFIFGNSKAQPEIEELWQASLNNLSKTNREKLTSIHNRVYIILLVHMIKGCLPLMLIAILSFPVVAMYSYLKSRSRLETELKAAKTIGIEKIEEQAMLEQRQEMGEPIMAC
jgi:hypothetical protein